MPIFVETYRATVARADCDHLGHMNVQHYFAAVGDGMFAIMVRLGLGPEEIRRRQMSFAVVRAETDFHQELHQGTSWPSSPPSSGSARSQRSFTTGLKMWRPAILQ
jgi:acyl-CoA thioesterase FadM